MMTRIRAHDYSCSGARFALAAALSLFLISANSICRADPGPVAAVVTTPPPSASSKASSTAPTPSLEISAAEVEMAFPYEYEIATYQKPWSGFGKGDHITIHAIRGNRPQLEVGGLYTVMGTYTLSSMDKAILGLFVTTRDNVGETPTFRHQMKRIMKGSGSFLLWFVITMDGDPHVSFYPASSGDEARGGVYFEGTSFGRRYVPGSADALGAVEPVFKYYLPSSGQVKIGQPIFKNFLDGQTPPFPSQPKQALPPGPVH